MNTLEKAKFEAPTRHSELFLKSRIPIYNSEVWILRRLDSKPTKTKSKSQDLVIRGSFDFKRGNLPTNLSDSYLPAWQVWWEMLLL